MNILLLIVLVFNSAYSSDITRPQNDLRFVLFNCQSQCSISYDGTYVYFVDTVYSNYNVRKKVTSQDRVQITSATKPLLADRSDEIIDNSCVMDGVHFQLILKTKDLRKRVFVGNSYEPRVNRLVGIVIKYLDAAYEPFKLNGIPYFDSKESIDYMIERQNDCDDKHINNWYNDWCDVKNF